MENETQIAEMIDALAEFDATGLLNLSDPEAVAADKRLDAATLALLSTLTGHSRIAKEGASTGSRYFEIKITTDDQDHYVRARVSNHRAKTLRDPVAWSFEVGADAASIRLGLAEIQREIDACLEVA